MAETVYRNAQDTRRYRLYQRIPLPGRTRGEWDVDVFTPGTIYSYAATTGDAFATRAAARAWAEENAGGKLISLPASTHPEVTSHWRYR